ncbi:MAG: phosphopyruvate hydratase [Acidobacteria bacterium]|nr:phosphopyruvate hydratase [Acidobacteriota bacterium]
MTKASSMIERVSARRVWDSRGRPTVEAEVRLAGGAVGRASAPAGASTGSGEAVDLRDGGPRLGGHDVTAAVRNVDGEIARALRGRDATDQAALDRALVDLDGTANRGRLGGNALIAVSMAALHAAAGAAGRPLWRHLLGGEPALLPLPEIQIFGGGAHAGRRVDIQDFMVMPVGASTFAEALDWTAEVYLAAGARMAQAGRLQGVADEGGYWPAFDTNEEALEFLVRAIEDAGRTPGDDLAISLDVAASEFHEAGRYRLGLDGRSVDSDGLIELLVGWIDRYPIASIEDPVAEDDDAGMRRFTAAAGRRVQIVGDDYLVTSAARVEQAAGDQACNALLVKPNQAGTVTETRAALDAARAAGFATIVSARSGETEDVTIAHLAVGWSAGQLKVGSFARSERMAKWNEVLRIEEALGDEARFAGAGALAPRRSRSTGLPEE